MKELLLHSESSPYKALFRGRRKAGHGLTDYLRVASMQPNLAPPNVGHHLLPEDCRCTLI